MTFRSSDLSCPYYQPFRDMLHGLELKSNIVPIIL